MPFSPVDRGRAPTASDKQATLVELVNVEKTYDGKIPVVRSLNLSIRRGEFLTLLGPSGSGKTSTLMMLAGFEDPTFGDILLNGKSLLKVPPYKRNIGVVFQSYALFPHMSVLDNIAFPLKQRRIPAAERMRRAQAALEMVELGAFGSRRPAKLSGGQQQRVALARALVFEPHLVLMDEPLGALDKSLREQMQLEIRRLHKELGMTVVYVTHDQTEALTMSDRIAIFHDGQIQQIGTPREIYHSPKTNFVANFVGESNCVEGIVLTNEAEGCHIRTDFGVVLACPSQPGLPVGAVVAAITRPEDLCVGTLHKEECNCLPARFVELIYSGDHSLIQVRLETGKIFNVRQSSRVSDGWREGDPCFVSWEYPATIVLTHDGREK
ncbi:ABC transporter ATP-binding protein [Mesorhizobium sp. B2-4-13]|uniref:ABC transporter ATP-binding protein n=1 Tax=Mesorhizobium sp. B2-4-13 TaxID=2589936 RepID=UPI001151E875|nr:ABC transporter ATP-binding protein [Mesorhizobium sp. B2-4-13]TPK87031.1 ABC transporter ATP-binding protein [Mesorhizobium sp. B2-4-13]